MKAKKPTRRPAPSEPQDLDVRYGKIGISAVAAAMRYHRVAGKPTLPFRAGKEQREGNSG
jgi:hypothetical protein